MFVIYYIQGLELKCDLENISGMYGQIYDKRPKNLWTVSEWGDSNDGTRRAWRCQTDWRKGRGGLHSQTNEWLATSHLSWYTGFDERYTGSFAADIGEQERGRRMMWTKIISNSFPPWVKTKFSRQISVGQTRQSIHSIKVNCIQVPRGVSIRWTSSDGRLNRTCYLQGHKDTAEHPHYNNWSVNKTSISSFLIHNV